METLYVWKGRREIKEERVSNMCVCVGGGRGGVTCTWPYGGLGERICVKDRKGREREYNENYKSYCGNAEVVREGLCWELTPHVLSPHSTGSCMDSYTYM